MVKAEDDMYLLPRNLQETHRLDFQHYLLRQLFKGLIVAPIDSSPLSILDVGCGTGRWPQEVAVHYPSTQVIGLDLDQSLQQRLPGIGHNYTFMQGNILNGLPFPDKSFDYVHQRLLVAGLPARQWPLVIRELVRVTRVSGWVELVEAGNAFIQIGPLTQQFLSWWIALSRTRGIDATIVERLGPLLQQAGIKQVKTLTFDLPIGAQGQGEQRRLGDLLARDMLAGFPNLKGPCHQVLNVPEREFDHVMQGLAQEWERFHSRYRFYVTYGQR
ncbi:hypothetical protein KDH_24990 [Dictyobacter sp. S3.2.2.5]|uniref:Methyltransferase domain-containing protein n=1 Tax=Dictyobacter halimunensis TaxID=3026934 RepID=A0ABQ6FPP6_9CHLR|nr:hypothetical protein KDH_24990 [Dictyobacter sp. S3.2.2.5]